jgi:hypothetical protein
MKDPGISAVLLKERDENNTVLWFLGSLLRGFLGGIAAYKTIQVIGGLEPIAKSEHRNLIDRANGTVVPPALPGESHYYS